jgi:hypothetical protein
MLCVAFGAGTALAQSAPSSGSFGDPAAPSAAAPKASAPEEPAPDVVRLKNGGLLRGRISELAPGSRVTIITMTGEARVFDMSEVSYAGSAARDPEASAAALPAAPPPSPPAQQAQPRWDQQPQQQPYVTVHAAEARIQFRSTQDRTTFYRRTGTAYAEGHYGWTRVSAVSKGFERICTAPCEASLPSGRETIAIGHDDGEPKELDSVMLPPGNSQLRLHVESNPERRRVGTIAIITGPIVAGVAALVLFYELQKCDRETCNDADRNIALVAAGVGAAGLGVGLGVGIPMLATSREKPVLETLPLSSARRRLNQAGGLTLSVKF